LYADRTVLGTDNSIYQLTPQAIAFPRGTDDLVRIARLAGDPRFTDVKLAPRGGGTGTNGQSLTDGLVVDVSRHMNRILDINVAERRVRVQAGVVKDQLNAALAEHRLFFAPELSTSNRATDRGHDQHRCKRSGLLLVREDARSCSVAHDRASRWHGLDLPAP
jgi:FAD/FMN-containing dehydrogenase